MLAGYFQNVSSFFSNHLLEDVWYLVSKVLELLGVLFQWYQHRVSYSILLDIPDVDSFWVTISRMPILNVTLNCLQKKGHCHKETIIWWNEPSWSLLLQFIQYHHRRSRMVYSKASHKDNTIRMLFLFSSIILVAPFCWSTGYKIHCWLTPHGRHHQYHRLLQ